MNGYTIHCPAHPALDRQIIASKIHTAMHRYFENLRLPKGETLALRITNTGPHTHDWIKQPDAAPCDDGTPADAWNVGKCRVIGCNSYSRATRWEYDKATAQLAADVRRPA